MRFIILPPASTAASYSVHIIRLHSVSTLSSSPTVCLGPRSHSQDLWNNSASPFSAALHARAGPWQQTPGSLVAHVGQRRCHVRHGRSKASSRVLHCELPSSRCSLHGRVESRRRLARVVCILAVSVAPEGVPQAGRKAQQYALSIALSPLPLKIPRSRVRMLVGDRTSRSRSTRHSIGTERLSAAQAGIEARFLIPSPLG